MLEAKDTGRSGFNPFSTTGHAAKHHSKLGSGKQRTGL